MGKKFVIYQVSEKLLEYEINQEYLKCVEKIKEKKFLIIEGSKNSRQQLYSSLYKYLNNKNGFNIWELEVDEDSDFDYVWKFIRDGSGPERYFIIENCHKNSNLQSKLFNIINKNINKLKNKIFLLHSEHSLPDDNWYNLRLPDNEDSNTKQNQKTIRYLLEKDEIFKSKINDLINNKVYIKAMEIEENINKLVEKNIEKEIFDPAEIFFLLCSIYLHDICVLKGISTRESIYDEITNNHKKYFLDEYEAEAVAKICSKAYDHKNCHKQIYEEEDIDLKSEELGIESLKRKIDIDFLAALFRFGKIIHCIRNEYEKKYKLIRYIDIYANPIQIQITPKSWNDLVKLIFLKEDLQSRFEKINGILNKKKIREIKFDLNESMQNIADNIKKKIKKNLRDELKDFRSQVEGWSYSAIQEEKGISKKFFHSQVEGWSEEKQDLFSWNKIPGNDDRRLIEFLTQNYGVDWVKTAKIDKIDDGKTIRLTGEKNVLSISLNNENTRVNLRIDDVRTDKFIVETENGELNIYEISRGTYYLLFIYYPENIGIHFEIMVSVHENFDRIGIELHMEGEGLHAEESTAKFFEELSKEKKRLGLTEDNFRKHGKRYRGLGEWKQGKFFENKMDDYIAETMVKYIDKLKPIIDEKYFKK